MPMRHLCLPVATLLTVVAAWAGSPLQGQSIGEQQLAYELRGVDVVQRIGEKLPLDVPFTDDNGHNVMLSQYFTPGVPVLLTLNYADCPLNCSLQLSDLSRALREMEWKPGQEFRIVTISINPREDFKRARQSKVRFLGESATGRQGDAGWHFLTSSDEQNVLRVAGGVGYSYRFDENSGEYIHKNAMFVISGEGVISHYIRSLGYEGSFLQAYLQASAAGVLGSPISEDGTGFGLNCFTMPYTDTVSRAYMIMRICGAVVLASVMLFLGYFWVRELRRPKARSSENAVNVEAA